MIRRSILIGLALGSFVFMGPGVLFAQKIPTKAKALFVEKYQGKMYRLRMDLRQVEPYVGTQYVDLDGPHFPNYKRDVIFHKLERVAIDDVGNLGGNFWIAVARQPGTGTRVVTAEVLQGLSEPLGVKEDPIERASKEFIASIELRIGESAEPLTTEQTLHSVEALLSQVFYIDTEPTQTDLEEFVLAHPDYPVEAVKEATGLAIEHIMRLRKGGQVDSGRENGCDRWTIKGVGLGMTLGQFKEAHSNAKHGRNWFRPDDRGRDWYFSAESRMHGLYTYVLPEGDVDASPIISVVAVIDMTDTSPTAVVEALIERWGVPKERETPVSQVRYFNAFGAPSGEVDQKATVWQDEACDVLVTAIERPSIVVSIDSISKLVIAAEERRRQAREAALEATRP